MSLSRTHLSLLLLLLVGLSVAASQKEERVSFLEKQLQELRNETQEDTKEIGRQKRQAEECLTDQYWDGRKCEWCTCPTGQQLRAVFCGHGVLVGNPGCQDCPPLTYRNGTDNNQTCHRCSSCSDPDAFVETPCSFDTDTVCRCRNGFVRRDTHCVSCRDHPDEEGCPPVTTPGIPPEPSPEPSPEPCPEPCPEPSPEPSQEIPKDESKKPDSRCISVWKVVLICIGCSGVLLIVGILIYRKYARIQSKDNQGTSGEDGEGGIDMKEQRNGHAVDAHAGAGDDHDSEHPPTENRVSAANGEANGLLAANGGGVNELNAE